MTLKSMQLIFYLLVLRKSEIRKSRKIRFYEGEMIQLLPKEQTDSKSRQFYLSVTSLDFIICSV